MIKKTAFSMCLIVCLLGISSSPAYGHTLLTPTALTDTWSAPVFILGTTLAHPDIDNAGTQIIAVDWNNGIGDNAKNLLISTYNGSTWSIPSVLASNAIYSSSLFQDPPRNTFPVISGDGATIAYLGYDTAARLYLIDKTAGTWGTPYPLPTGFACVDNDMEISDDGDTVTFSNCPSFMGTMRVYVAHREAGIWQPYVLISGSGAGVGGAQASISADGKKLVYQDTYHIFFSELLADGSWSTPLKLTNCYFSGSDYYMYLPKISPDGKAIFFWRYQLSGSTVTGKDLFTMRRFGNSWSRPLPISGASIVPTLSSDSRPAVEQNGTRVVFSRDVNGTPFTGSQIELTEFVNGQWTQPTVLSVPYEGNYPNITPDGKKLIFEHTNYTNAGVAAIGTSANPPGFSDSTANTSISPTGGTLVSATDNVTTTFSANTFSANAVVTHTVVPRGNFLPSIGEMGNLGQGFSLSAVDASTQMPIQADSGHPFSIQVNYSLYSGPAIETTLKIYGWDANACNWTELTSVLDTNANTIGASGADNLTLFAVLGDTLRQYLPQVAR